MKRLALALAFAPAFACTETFPAELRPPEPPPFDASTAPDDASTVDASSLDAGIDASVVLGSTVTGEVVIAEAGASTTSVILAPESFDIERFHDARPSGPRVTGVSGAWSIPDVPAGTYVVLAGYEQDGLVLDPSASPPKIVVSGNPGETIAVASPQKLVRALTVVTISSISSKAAITFVDGRDEDAYDLSVIDFMSKPTYAATEPASSSNANVTFAVGANLVVPLRYRFRVTAKRNGVVITQTEDLAAVRTAAPDDT